MALPQIAGYTLSIQQNGNKVFKTLSNVESFIPSKTHPVKIYAYGSGMFAVVFKIKMNGRFYAVRCFISSKLDIAGRYKLISNYLDSNVYLDWKVNFKFLDNEFLVDNQYHPVIIMDWVDGVPVNKYVTLNLTNKQVLTELQVKILKVAASLTGNGLGHGDLQAGNMMIDTNNDLKLIDYDSMFVPAMKGQKCIELGRPEYQHPKRTAADYNEKEDWFSVWVMITALEALKAEPNLWNLVNGEPKGFNTLDNFLFTGDDFQKPHQSPLFRRLLNINDKALSFYLNKLISFCGKEMNDVTMPVIYGYDDLPTPPKPPGIEDKIDTDKDRPFDHTGNDHNSNFIIESVPPATVLSSNFQKIANTPCTLAKTKFSGKKVLVSYGNQVKSVELVAGKDLYNIIF